MLRMVALGLVIPLGVGVLSAMELSTPPRHPPPAVQSSADQIALVRNVADTTSALPHAQDTLAKGDRLEVAALSRETSVEAAPVEQPVNAAVSERTAVPDVSVAPSQPTKPVDPVRHEPKLKVAAPAPAKPKHKTAQPKPAQTRAAKMAAAPPKAAEPRRAAVSQRSQPAGETGACRLKAFGGLLRALGSNDCDI